MATFKKLNELKSEKEENDFNGYLGIAWNSVKLNDFKTGIEYAEKAIEVGNDSLNWQAYDTLAWIAIKSKDMMMQKNLLIKQTRQQMMNGTQS